jgi:[ribosomal protein S18]-alanine N-acetyltransferase
MSNRHTVFPATAADIPQIMPVMASAFDPTYGEAWNAPQCAAILSLPGSTMLIAKMSGQVVGFALFRTIGDEAELLLLAVRKEFQGNGLGRMLLAHVIEDAQSAGVLRLHLEVRNDNPARRFYTRNRFFEVGLRKNYYRGIEGQLQDAVTLSLSIG